MEFNITIEEITRNISIEVTTGYSFTDYNDLINKPDSVDVSDKADVTYVDAADSNLQDQIDSLNANPVGVTQGYVDTQDAATLSSANSYTDTGLANKEDAFAKNGAFNKDFGTTSGSIAQGNDSRILNGQTAFSWGDHTIQGYLTSYTETDPVFSASASSLITDTDIANWDNAVNKVIQSVTVTGTNTKTLTITFADNTTLTTSFADLVGASGSSDGNDFLNSATFDNATGIITLNRTDGGSVTVDIDGRFALSSHTHTISQITDFPSIPNSTSDLVNDSGFITGVSWAEVTDKPTEFTPSAHNHVVADITDFPSIPSNTSDLTNDSGFIISLPTHNHDDLYYTEAEVDSLLDGKVDDAQVLTNVPAGALFTDTVYDDTALQLEVDGKANASHTHTVSEITDMPTIPTNTSDLTNDSGFLTGLPVHNHDDLYYTEGEVDTLLNGKVDDSQVLTDVPAGAVFTDTVYDDTQIQSDIDGKADASHTHTVSEITDFPSIPSNTSDLTNDSGFISDVSGKADITYVDSQDATKLDKTATVQAFWRGDQTAYDALGSYDANTIYFIEE